MDVDELMFSQVFAGQPVVKHTVLSLASEVRAVPQGCLWEDLQQVVPEALKSTLQLKPALTQQITRLCHPWLGAAILTPASVATTGFLGLTDISRKTSIIDPARCAEQGSTERR